MINLTRTHKVSGWTRTPLRDGSGCWRIVPADGSGIRIVRFLSAHCWQNDPADDRARADVDRIVLISGPALPEWAAAWLTAANAKSRERARETFAAAMDQAEYDRDARTWGDY